MFINVPPPVPPPPGYGTRHLRDQVAIAVLPQLLSENRNAQFASIAVDAYAIADAMIEARKATATKETP